jgi:hypothetical protein
MKHIIYLLFALLLIHSDSKAQKPIYCHSDGPVKTLLIEVFSEEDTSTLSGQISVQFKIKAIDTSSIDSIRLNLGDWFTSYSIGSYTSSMLENDSQTITATIYYDTNAISFYPEQVRISCYAKNNQSEQFQTVSNVPIFFTPYNSIEIWNINDFHALPRVWCTRETPQPARVILSKDSIPISNRPILDSNSADWEWNFQIVNLPHLAYGVEMAAVHPDTVQAALVPNPDPAAFAIYTTFSGTLVGRLRAEVTNDLGVPILMPLSGVRIQLREQGIFDNTLDEQVTNPDGTFTFTWDNAARFGETIKLWLPFVLWHPTFLALFFRKSSSTFNFPIWA